MCQPCGLRAAPGFPCTRLPTGHHAPSRAEAGKGPALRQGLRGDRVGPSATGRSRLTASVLCSVLQRTTAAWVPRPPTFSSLQTEKGGADEEFSDSFLYASQLVSNDR